MSRALFTPMFLVGTDAPIGGGGGGFNGLDDQLQEEPEDVEADYEKEDLARLINAEFMLPFKDANYNGIDQSNRFDELIQRVSSHNDDERMILAMYSMTAALGARTLDHMLRSSNANLKNCSGTRNRHAERIAELEREIRLLKGDTADMKSLGTQISAKLEAQSVEVLPMIAQVNITMGWYYFMHGFEPSKPLDPVKYMEARRMVDTYGNYVDPMTSRYPAYDELMRRLIEMRRRA